jgi:hypothetical protein
LLPDGEVYPSTIPGDRKFLESLSVIRAAHAGPAKDAVGGGREVEGAAMIWALAGAIGVANAVFLVLYKWRGWMTYDRYWLSLAFVVSPFAWAFGLYFLEDYIHSLPSSGDELVHGEVFMRQRGADSWGMEHPELTIQVEGKKDMVKANLRGDTDKKIPNRVSFYYSGDPNKEVHLREETNPLWAALFLLLTPLLVAAVLIYVERKRFQVAASASGASAPG